MKKVWTLTALLLAVLLCSPAVSFAEKGGKKKGRHGKSGIQKLGLTEDQKTKLQESRKQCMESMKTHMEKIKGLHSELREALKAEKTDTGKIKQIVAKIKTERVDQMKRMQASQDKLASLLNPVQAAKMELMMGNQMMGGKPGRAGGKGMKCDDEGKCDMGKGRSRRWSGDEDGDDDDRGSRRARNRQNCEDDEECPPEKCKPSDDEDEDEKE